MDRELGVLVQGGDQRVDVEAVVIADGDQCGGVMNAESSLVISSPVPTSRLAAYADRKS